MLRQDQVGLVVDTAGQPASSALSFHAAPAALAAAGPYVVTAGDVGLAVFERSSGECVQQLPYGEGIVAAPGQQVLAADVACGSCIAIAGNRKVRVPRPPLIEHTGCAPRGRPLIDCGRNLHLSYICVHGGGSGVEIGHHGPRKRNWS